MRKEHMVVIFGLLFLALFVGAFADKTIYERMFDEKQEVDYALQVAADAAAEQLARTYQNVDVTDYLISASDEFFKSLVAGFSLYEKPDEQEELYYYVPALLVTVTDGFYVNYLSEVDIDGAVGVKRVWTECQPYSYSDDYFVYRFFLDDRIIIYEKLTGDSIDKKVSEVFDDPAMLSALSKGNVFTSEENYKLYKKSVISDCIATVIERMVNEHSRIAGQYGYNVLYTVPDFFSYYTPSQSFPSFVAVFQGYPLSWANKTLYNNVSSSAAHISLAKRYVVEVSNSLEQPYSVYHKEGCLHIGSYGKVLSGMYEENEVIREYGAYACGKCFSEDEGVSVLPE